MSIPSTDSNSTSLLLEVDSSPVVKKKNQRYSRIDKGIDPRERLFEKKRLDEEVNQLDGCTSCWLQFFSCLCLPITCCCSIKNVKPMHDSIVYKCGVVTNVLRQPGPHCIGPFCTTTDDVYMGLNTTEIHTKGSTDSHGSPLVVSAQFVWRITDSLAANFKTSNLQKFLTDQSESALRAVLAQYPYDIDANDKKHGYTECLTKQSDKIDNHLIEVFQAMIDIVGVEIDSFKLITVSYEPKMEKLLLARQEAQAEVTARTAIAEGTTGIVQETLSRLQTLGIELSKSETNKFAMNLSLILVNHGHTTLNLFDSTQKT